MPEGKVRLSDQNQHFDQAQETAKALASEVGNNYPERHRLAMSADWHIRGLIYHYNNICSNYTLVAQDVVEFLNITESDVVIRKSDAYSNLLFEVYATINLAKISLDNLRNVLEPVFVTNKNNMPKSVRGLVGGQTDCPVYEELAENELLPYLMDLRNCLVHYRTFAVSENIFAQEKGINMETDFSSMEWFTSSLAKIYFEKIDKRNIAVNIYLPDEIFVENRKGGKSLAVFDYQQGNNILAMTRNIVQMSLEALLASMSYLNTLDEPEFKYENS